MARVSDKGKRKVNTQTHIHTFPPPPSPSHARTVCTDLVLTVAHWKNLKSEGEASLVMHNSLAMAVLGLGGRRGGRRKGR